MSEAGRVFARLTTPGSLPSPEDKQLLHVTSRRRGAVPGQSRVVEVVHRRSGRTAPLAEPTHAAPWWEDIQGHSTPTLLLAEEHAATAAPVPQVGHLMPGWKPLLLQPAEDAPEVQPRMRPQQRIAKPKRSKDQPMSTKRAFADPFAADDTGTNCIRCGYLVSPAREKRGLLTCTQCR
jgi:hypothetical protein